MALDDAARWSVADQLAHGVTTIGHTGPGRAPFDALRAFGARGVAYFETFGPDPAQRDASLADLHARVTAARLDESALVRVGVSPHAPYSVSDALYLGVAQYALREALPMAVHIAESHEESQLVTRGAGPFATLLQDRGIDVRPRAASPIALLERTGILAARPLCIHAVQADESDARRLAAAGATVAHCPRANAWFGYGTAPVAEFRAHGVCVGLGTDSLASNTDVRLLSEAAAAADEALLPAARLALATIGGAAALGLESATGSLEAGKQADLAAFSISDIVACDAQPERYVVERCTDSASILTVVAGAVRARNGRATALTPSDDALPARVAAHRLRAEAWAGERRAHDPRFKA
jgi:5-methylthioadenosine/S-adenosylhomocysteine deaminase